jgi:hypothetical protein
MGVFLGQVLVLSLKDREFLKDGSLSPGAGCLVSLSGDEPMGAGSRLGASTGRSTELSDSQRHFREERMLDLVNWFSTGPAG